MARKRRPFVAVELDAFVKIHTAAGIAAQPEADVGWRLVLLWRYARQVREVELPQSTILGFCAGSTDEARQRSFLALVAVGFLRAVEGRPDTWRVCGLLRYLSVATAQAESAKKTNEKKSRSGPSSVEEEAEDEPHEDESGTVSVRSPSFIGPQRYGERGEDRRSKIEDRRSKIEDRMGPALDLFGGKAEKPKRNGGRNLELWESMQALRLEADPELEPERVSPAWLNRRIPELVERMRVHWESPNEPDTALVDFVWAAYLREGWAREKSPPWPFAPFQSDEVFGRLLLAADRLIDERAADRAAEKAGGGA